MVLLRVEGGHTHLGRKLLVCQVVQNLAYFPILLPPEEGEVRTRPLGDGIKRSIERSDACPDLRRATAIDGRVPLLDERNAGEFLREPPKLVIHSGRGRLRGRQEVGQSDVNLLLRTKEITRAALAAKHCHGGRGVGLTGRRRRVWKNPRLGNKRWAPPEGRHREVGDAGPSPDSR